MKLVSLQSPNRLGVVATFGSASEFVAPLDPAEGWPTDMKQLIADFDAWKPKLDTLTSGERPYDAEEFVYAKLDAPIRGSEKLICVGKNYAEHAREMGGDVPELPVIFSKFSSAINAPGADVILPAISQQVDFEAELVVVIGKTGRNIEQQNAHQHIFGYCCGNDVSARDWQKGRPGGQWLLGKTFDTFAPLGPQLVTADEIVDPAQLKIELRLNGQTMQSASTSDLIFKIDYLVSHISQFVTLKPGDLIFTGTPSGVGAGRKPPLFLKNGDELAVEISGLGVLVSRVKDAALMEA